RADRARSHKTDEVADVLRRYGVLLLHGPAHHPRFYGQLERQNREHRAFLRSLDPLDANALDEVCEGMLHALNILWKRPTLDWRTANDVWIERPNIDEDREKLRQEVYERATKIRRHLNNPSVPTDLAERLAIEHALTTRGYLRRQPGGWC